MKEIAHDAAELEDEAINGVGDATDKMRKVTPCKYFDRFLTSYDSALLAPPALLLHSISTLSRGKRGVRRMPERDAIRICYKVSP